MNIDTHTERMQMREFAVVGLGMMGGSIAKDIRTHYPDSKIYAYDPSPETINKALDENIIDLYAPIDEILTVASFAILATPIDDVVPVAEAIVKSASSSQKAVVIDIASVKKNIVTAFSNLTSGNVEFIGTHPMAGTEFSGVTHAKKDLFRAKPWMVCPHQNNTNSSLEVACSFIRSLGGRVRSIDAAKHDEMVAVVSHSIIMLSNYIFDFVATQHPDALEFAGDGFTSTTRLASGNPFLHQQIMGSNLGEVVKKLKEFQGFLDHKLAQDTLDVGDDYFSQNADRRNKWLSKRK